MPLYPCYPCQSFAAAVQHIRQVAFQDCAALERCSRPPAVFRQRATGGAVTLLPRPGDAPPDPARIRMAGHYPSQCLRRLQRSPQGRPHLEVGHQRVPLETYPTQVLRAADIRANFRKGKPAHDISPVALVAVNWIDAIFDIGREINGLLADNRQSARKMARPPPRRKRCTTRCTSSLRQCRSATPHVGPLVHCGMGGFAAGVETQDASNMTEGQQQCSKDPSSFVPNTRGSDPFDGHPRLRTK